MTDQFRVPAGVPTGGQFAASEKGEAEVHLSSTSATYDAPLSAAEFGIAADKSQEMARMEADDLVGLPDGSNVELIASEADDAVVGDIVEVGTYVRTFPDQTSLIYGFSNLSERADAHDSIAFEAVRRSREQAATGSDDLPDPWGDEEPLAEARAEQAAGAHFESEMAARTEPGTTPTEVENRSMKVRTDADGKRYVDDPDSFWHGTEIIHSYTRSQALADGVLKDRLDDGTDLNQMAREAGIPVNVAFTQAAFEDSVAWKDSNAELQDESGRAWDVLCMANRPIRAHAAKTGGSLRVGDRIPFTFIRVPNTPRAQVPRQQTLVAVFGTDDNGEPCFTIMKTDED